MGETRRGSAGLWVGVTDNIIEDSEMKINRCVINETVKERKVPIEQKFVVRNRAKCHYTQVVHLWEGRMLK